MKRIISTAAIACVTAFGLNTAAQAAGAVWSPDYHETVPIINDYESKPIKKNTTGSAHNKVKRIDSGKLVSWVENSSGTNLTTKESYTSPGRYYMDYSNASDSKGRSLHLNISTSSGTMHSVYTVGTWTPN